jgi:serine/threonine protein phosphatase 1
MIGLSSILKYLSSNPREGSNKALVFDDQPCSVYAIGDVHGCIDLYKPLEEKISEIARLNDEQAYLFVLGDIIDRGPSSAQTIDHFLGKNPKNLKRTVLFGNHEDMFLRFYLNPERNSAWLSNGGIETLRSYGINEEIHKLPKGRALQQLLAACIPEEHIHFLQSLPLCVHFPNMMLSHAGASAKYPLHSQKRKDLIWGDPNQLDENPMPVVVIHGHKPTANSKPFQSRSRVNVDTGAYATGILTAVEVTTTLQFRFITV